jgi:hypothetical protein
MIVMMRSRLNTQKEKPKNNKEKFSIIKKTLRHETFFKNYYNKKI